MHPTLMWKIQKYFFPSDHKHISLSVFYLFKLVLCYIFLNILSNVYGQVVIYRNAVINIKDFTLMKH